MIGKYEQVVFKKAQELGTTPDDLVNRIKLKDKYKKIVLMRLPIENGKHKHSMMNIADVLDTDYSTVQSAIRRAACVIMTS